MLFDNKPDNFNPKFEIVSCFVEFNKEILLLLRQDHKSEGNTWGIPTGKIEKGENTMDAMIREMKEETGLQVASNEIRFLKDLFMRFPTYDFKASVFRLTLNDKPRIIINPGEHKEFRWASLEETQKLPLIYDLDNWIKYFYKNTGA